MEVSAEAEWPSPEQRAERHTFVAHLLLPRRSQGAAAYDVAAELWSSHTGAATTREQLIGRVSAKPAVARKLAPVLWETYAARGMIPGAWVDDPSRFFVKAQRRLDARSSLARLTDPAGMVRTPGFCEALMLAADPRGISAAEALARQVSEALQPWGGALPSRVLWRFTEIDVPQRPRTHEHFASLATAGRAVTYALSQNARKIPAQWSEASPMLSNATTEHLRWEGAAVMDFAHWRRWSAAARFGYVVESHYHSQPPPELHGRSYGSLPDPFSPLVDLWWRGYGLEAITPEAVVLVASRAYPWGGSKRREAAA